MMAVDPVYYGTTRAYVLLRYRTVALRHWPSWTDQSWCGGAYTRTVRVRVRVRTHVLATVVLSYGVHS